MSAFFSILFQGIPGVLFEPIAVGAVLGMITAAVIYWKRHTPLYWLIGLSIFFMIGWRLLIQIVSSRYSVILLIPAVIATGFCCFQTEWLIKYIPKFPEKWRKTVPYLSIIGLGIASIGQSLHLNPYGDYIIRAADLIKTDAQGTTDPHILTIDHEMRRLSYYTGFPSSSIMYAGLPEDAYIKNIGDRIHKAVSVPATKIYVILFESVKHPKGYYLQKVSPGIKNDIHCIGEFYHNRKKRRVTRIYRYDYADYFNFSCRPVLENDSPVKKKADVRITFDKTYPETHSYYKNVMAHFRKQNGLKAPELKDFPIDWFVVGTPGYLPDANAELGIVTGWDGSKVFRIKADKFISTYTGRMYPAKKWHVVMKVSGKKGTVFDLATHSYDAKLRNNGFPFFPAIKLPEDNRVYEYKITIPEGFYTPETKYIRPTVYLTQGVLLVHSIELYSEAK